MTEETREYPKLWASFRDALLDIRRIEHMRRERYSDTHEIVHIVMYSGKHFTSKMPTPDVDDLFKRIEGTAVI